MLLEIYELPAGLLAPGVIHMIYFDNSCAIHMIYPLILMIMMIYSLIIPHFDLTQFYTLLCLIRNSFLLDMKANMS